MSKNFPFTGGGGGESLDKKIFPPVWTCIKPNLVSKNFPFTRGGGPLTKNFFSPSLNMYQAKSGVKKFSLYWEGGGPLTKKIFFQSEHVSSQIWCQKFFPLLGEGVPWQKNFFPVWTCIKQNLVSKNFPFMGGGGGGPLTKKIFFQSEHVSSQIWCQKFFPFIETGTPPPPPVQGWISLPENLRPGTPPPSNAGSAYPKIWDLGPPLNVNRHLWKQYLPVVLRTRAVTNMSPLTSHFPYQAMHPECESSVSEVNI